jgi:S1-C subfamily serine protease
MKSPLRSLFAVLALACFAASQVAPPKRESNSAHVKHSRAENYSQRFNNLKCALVLIRTPTEYGTGFFVSPDGDIATASHVLGQRTFYSGPDGHMKADLTMPTSFTVVDQQGSSHEVPASNVEKNGDAWGADVALLKSGIRSGCWLAVADDSSVVQGEHLITLGFPGLASGSLSIYIGIMSARLKLDSIIGVTKTGEPVKPQNDFIRVQMPISPGLSGAPVIDDDNHVIAIVSAAGFSTAGIDLLIQLNHLKAFEQPPAQGAPPPPPGQRQVSLNPFSLLAEFAENLRNFASPGYGDAVPMRYLKKATP